MWPPRYLLQTRCQVLESEECGLSTNIFLNNVITWRRHQGHVHRNRDYLSFLHRLLQTCNNFHLEQHHVNYKDISVQNLFVSVPVADSNHNDSMVYSSTSTSKRCFFAFSSFILVYGTVWARGYPMRRDVAFHVATYHKTCCIALDSTVCRVCLVHRCALLGRKQCRPSTHVIPTCTILLYAPLTSLHLGG